MIDVFAYIRVSTNDQSVKGNLSLQRDDLKRYAKRNNLNIIRWYEDVQTGTTAERPQLMIMLKDLEKTGCGVLLYDLDRLTRMNLLDSIQLSFQIRDLTQGKFFIVNDTIDFSKHSNSADLFLMLKAYFAREWFLRIKDLQKKGIEKYKKEKGRWGRRPKKFNKQRYIELKSINNPPLSLMTIAHVMGMSKPTLVKHLKKHGLYEPGPDPFQEKRRLKPRLKHQD